MTRTSVRALAKRLGCSHAAITKAYREHRLTAGLALEGDKLVVTDPDACEAQWRAIRQPRVRGRAPSPVAIAQTGPVAGLNPAAAPAFASDAVPPYELSRARREAALADIATAEARGVTGGEWIPRAQVDEIVAKYDEVTRTAVRLLRERLPMAVHRRINLQELARVCAALGAKTKHVCGAPMGPIADSQIVFRIAMHEIELACDEVLNEIVDLFGAPAAEAEEIE